MPIVSNITEEQASQIPVYIEKWKDVSFLTTPIDHARFEQGIKDVHEEIGIEIPSKFLYYPSPAAMWRDFENWAPKITTVLTQYWSYQIPLCNAYGMHRLWKPGNERPAFNFAATRYSPGRKYALCETKDSDETSGTLIEKALHTELWKQFAYDFKLPIDWSLLGYYACGENEPPEDYLSDIAEREDNTLQVHPQDCCFLGPENWLLLELACVDFCHHVLGIERNERLYRGLEAIVQSGSFCGTFGKLCVASERPSAIEITEKGFNLTFRDGEVFISPPRREW